MHPARPQSVIALVAGVLILFRPTVLNYVVGVYLIVIGLLDSGILGFQAAARGPSRPEGRVADRCQRLVPSTVSSRPRYFPVLPIGPFEGRDPTRGWGQSEHQRPKPTRASLPGTASAPSDGSRGRACQWS